jgi:hypothetical protein
MHVAVFERPRRVPSRDTVLPTISASPYTNLRCGGLCMRRSRWRASPSSRKTFENNGLLHDRRLDSESWHTHCASFTRHRGCVPCVIA